MRAFVKRDIAIGTQVLDSEFFDEFIDKMGSLFGKEIEVTSSIPNWFYGAGFQWHISWLEGKEIDYYRMTH